MDSHSKTPIIPFVDLSAEYNKHRNEFLAAIDSVCSKSAYILGNSVEKFERQFADFVGTDHCIGVANGTDALTLSYRALGVGPGDEVIVPAHTFIATIIAIMEVGATPVFVDIDPTTYLIDYSKLESALTKKTKAICPVHLYGCVCDMDIIEQFAESYDLFIVEDAAQAHGAMWKNKSAGSFGDCAGFSFYPAKNLGCFGDGGAITTNDASIANKLRALRNYGSEVKYYHPSRGGNSRLDALQAEVLSIKLPHLEAANRSRHASAMLYKELLPSTIQAPLAPQYPQHVFHLFVVQIDDRERIQRELLENGIHTGIHYPIPNHLQTGYAELGYSKGDFPVTEELCSRILSLPMFPEMTKVQIERVVNELSKCLK